MEKSTVDFRNSAQLEAEINRLSDLMHEARAREGKEFLREDLGLQSAVTELSKAYERRDWMKMKNSAAYIMEIKTDSAPEMASKESEWAEISAPNFGVTFPVNWNMPKDIVIPRGKMLMLAAKQKTGKTRGALSLALDMADKGFKISIASGEMYSSQIWLNMWMQRQFLDFRNSFGEIEARTMMASKDFKWQPNKDAYHDFRNRYDDKICVHYTAGYTARRVLYSHKLMSENTFGKRASVKITDYVQILAPDPTIKDIRQQHIYNSQLLSIDTGIENSVHIAVSQTNEQGVTSESTQYEKDAGMVVNLIREEDAMTGEKSPELMIHIKHSRSTRSGKFRAWLDVKSGAIVPSSTYTPADRQGRFYE
jgi:hypothetical protein